MGISFRTQEREAGAWDFKEKVPDNSEMKKSKYLVNKFLPGATQWDTEGESIKQLLISAPLHSYYAEVIAPCLQEVF